MLVLILVNIIHLQILVKVECKMMLLLYTVGAEATDDGIKLLLSEVKGKDITELIATGREKLASVPCGGGAAVAVTATGGAGSGAGAAPAAAETKKEEKVEEKEESDDVSIL